MKSFITTLLLTLICWSLSSQENHNIHALNSEVFGEERQIYVYLPGNYFENTSDTFMVTYVLDAQSSAFWAMAKNNIGYLVDNYQVVPMIAVGIHTEDRQNEYIPSPKNVKSNSKTRGKAHLLQKHFEEEIFPFIENEYRVNQHRAIIGHSRGGGFVNHTLFSDNYELFNAYIGISPAMGYWNNQILNDADSVLKSRESFHKYLFASHGDVGSYEHTFSNQVDFLDSLISISKNKSLGWDRVYIEGVDHWSCVIPSINAGLVKMSRQYWVDQKILEEFAENKNLTLKEQIDEFYYNQHLKYGYTVLPDPRILIFIGNDFGEMGKEGRALETYEWGLELDPSNVSINRNIAWVYKQKKRYEKAIEYYQNALINLDLIKDNMSEKRYNQIADDIQSNIQALLEATKLKN